MGAGLASRVSSGRKQCPAGSMRWRKGNPLSPITPSEPHGLRALTTLGSQNSDKHSASYDSGRGSRPSQGGSWDPNRSHRKPTAETMNEVKGSWIDPWIPEFMPDSRSSIHSLASLHICSFIHSTKLIISTALGPVLSTGYIRVNMTTMAPASMEELSYAGRAGPKQMHEITAHHGQFCEGNMRAETKNYRVQL